MKQVVEFLQAIAEHNDREWFAMHRGEYNSARMEFDAFVEQLIAGVMQFDPAIVGLCAKDCTYRIYRDTRFSHDKRPYKTHFGAFIAPGGKNGGAAGYYFHTEPAGRGMVGGNIMCAGIYMPEPAVLRSIREDIAYRSEEFLSTIHSAATVGMDIDRDNVLRRTPQGFPSDTAVDEYLRLKDVSLYRYFPNEELLVSDLAERTIAAFHAAAPFVALLNRAARFAKDKN